MKIKNVFVGSDPEVFLVNEQGEVKSAIGLLGGSKQNPRPISEDGHFVQEDNILAEFNIPPVNTAEGLINEINFCKNWIKDYVEPLKLTIKVSASELVGTAELANKKAREFGCDPDFCAYDMSQNIAPKASTNLRSAGGHISVSYDDPDPEVSIELLKIFDLFLGIPSLLMDKDQRRRELYGKAGCFRLKSYGFEYRTLSNFWIQDDAHIKWAFDNVMAAIDFYNSGKAIPTEDYKLIQDTINNSDKAKALEFVNKYGIKLHGVGELELHFDSINESSTEAS